MGWNDNDKQRHDAHRNHEQGSSQDRYGQRVAPDGSPYAVHAGRDTGERYSQPKGNRPDHGKTGIPKRAFPKAKSYQKGSHAGVQV